MPDTKHRVASYGRWYILGLICLMYLITYLDRVNIATAAPEISKEFGFDKITMGAIFSAFVWAYALFQVPGGWLNDRFGARTVLTAIVTYWSMMTAATAAATSGLSFVIVRFLFGVGEAGAFPGATRAMQLWYPRQERGLIQGLTHSASRLGAAIAPPIVVLIITTLGWRSVFYICGAVGFVWAAWWYFSYRNLPEEHGLVNEAEPPMCRGQYCCDLPTCGRSCAPTSPMCIASTSFSPGFRPIWWKRGTSPCSRSAFWLRCHCSLE